jgi:sialate O-acetylesterase
LPFHSFDEFKKLEDAWRVTKTGGWPGSGTTFNALPSNGYNTRIYPLHPFAVRGVLFWAIGSSLHGVAAPLDVAMHKQWRELFGQDLYFIEMANCRFTSDQPPLTPCFTTNWTSGAGETTRQAALLQKDDKKMAFVDLYDTGNWVTHFLEMGESGRRIGFAALTLAYGQNHLYTGPRLVETKIEGHKATVRFDHVGDGLIYQPSIDGISGICLLGKSGPPQWAQVKVLGQDTLELSSPDIADLAGVAYGENTNPHETLFNSEGGRIVLPAPPFSTTAVSGGTWPKFQIATLVGENNFHILDNEVIKNARLSLAHVRRSGYVFQIVGQETLNNAMQPISDTSPDLAQSSATTPILAYIPAEWKGYEVVTGDKYDIRSVGGFVVTNGSVVTGGKPIKATESTKDGARFITFNAPVDLTWVIVAEKGRAAEFRKINRY